MQRRVQSAREAAGTGLKLFPGHGRQRDEDLIRLRKEVRALWTANAILKKTNVPQAHVIFAQAAPSDGVPVHTTEPGNLHRQGDDRAVGVKRRGLLPVGPVRALNAAAGSGRRVATPHPGKNRTAALPVGQPQRVGGMASYGRQTGQSENSSPVTISTPACGAPARGQPTRATAFRSAKTG
jgi:hypothetical protein